MKVFVQIDLVGTRAVVFDEAGAVLGRGETHPRRDHAATGAAARRAALADARLTLIRRALAARRLDATTIDRLVQRLEERLRLGEHLVRLKQLEARLLTALPAIERTFPGARLEPAAREILAKMWSAAPALLQGARPRSTSFRDVAADEWARLARAAASSPERPYEALLAAFDAAVSVEEQRADVTLPMVSGVAVSDAVARGDLATQEAHGVELALERAACTPFEVVTHVTQEVPA